jgi:predicted acylesterase/phospholipase RssA
MKSVWIFALLILAVVRSSAADGIGFAFSGAGGRIGQHASLMEALVKGLSPDGIKRRPSYLAGASSGAISTIALNAILQTEDQHLQNGFSWDDYRNLVFNLKTSDVYDNSVWGIAKILTYNIFEGYFLDNTPLRSYLAPYLQKMNYSKLGDLYLPTCITLVNQSSGLDVRLWSTDPQYKNLDILDVIMATTALPMAFPPRQVTGLGDTIWIDGGTGIDTLPVFPLLHHANVSEVYAIVYGSALTSGGAQLPSYLADILIVVNALSAINDMRVDLFAGAFDIAARSSTPSFSYMPALNQTFSALDFDQEKFEYTLAMDWALQNNPTPLNENATLGKNGK